MEKLPKPLKFASLMADLLSNAVHVEMPMRQLIFLLNIAENEGVSQKDLQKLTKTDSAGVTRNLRALGTHYIPDPENPKRKIQAGYGLIDNSTRHPDNTRSYAVYLTQKGKRLMAKLAKLGDKVLVAE